MASTMMAASRQAPELRWNRFADGRHQHDHAHQTVHHRRDARQQLHRRADHRRQLGRGHLGQKYGRHQAHRHAHARWPRQCRKQR